MEMDMNKIKSIMIVIKKYIQVMKITSTKICMRLIKIKQMFIILKLKNKKIICIKMMIGKIQIKKKN